WVGVLKETEAGYRLRTCAGGWDERGEFLSFEGGHSRHSYAPQSLGRRLNDYTAELALVGLGRSDSVKSRRKGRGTGARGQPNLKRHPPTPGEQKTIERQRLYGALTAESDWKADPESLTLGRDDHRGTHRS